MTHTPGNWISAAPHNGSVGDGIYTADMKTLIAHCNANTLTTEQNRINAHLIAAAPELLESLKTAVNWIQQYAPQNRRKIELDKILGVIAKAEGK